MLKAKMIKWEQEYLEKIAKGEEQGREIGRVEGRVEGRLEGRRATLKKQLQLKFQTLPDWAEQRLEAASETQLEEWACRLISCNDLAAILA